MKNTVLLIIIFYIPISYLTGYCQQSIPASGKNTLVLGFSESLFTISNTQDALAATEVLTRIIINKEGLNFEPNACVFNSIEEITNLFQKGQIDLVSMHTYEYIKIANHVAIIPIAVAEIDGNIFENFIILARKDSGIETIDQLKDKRLIVGSEIKNNLPVLWMLVSMAQNNIFPTRNYFKSTKTVIKESSAILPVFFNQADICLVTKRSFKILAELNPQIEKELLIIKESPEYLFAIFSYNENSTQIRYKKNLEKIMLNLHKNIDGSQIMSMYKLNKLVPFNAVYLNNVIQLDKEYHRIKKEHPEVEYVFN